MATSIATGFALGPDIDHPNSTISKSLGRPVHEVFHGMSTVARTVLATNHDRRRFEVAKERGIDPSHRGLTHTLVFAAAMGGLAFSFGQNALATSLLAALCVVVCRRLVPGCWQVGILGAAVGMLAFGSNADLHPEAVGLAALAGWVSHIIADACTTAGVPLMWPLRFKGRYWWRLRLLGGWLKSGEKKEYVAALGVAVVMNIPYFVFT